MYHADHPIGLYGLHYLNQYRFGFESSNPKIGCRYTQIPHCNSVILFKINLIIFLKKFVSIFLIFSQRSHTGLYKFHYSNM